MKPVNPRSITSLVMCVFCTAPLFAEPVEPVEQQADPITEFVRQLKIHPQVAKTHLEYERRALKELASELKRAKDTPDAPHANRLQTEARIEELENAAAQLRDQQTQNLLRLYRDDARLSALQNLLSTDAPLSPQELELYQASPLSQEVTDEILLFRERLKLLSGQGLPPDHPDIQELQQHLARLVRDDGTPGVIAAGAFRAFMLNHFQMTMAEQQRELSKIQKKLQDNKYSRLKLFELLYFEQMRESEMNARQIYAAELETHLAPPANAPAASQPE